MTGYRCKWTIIAIVLFWFGVLLTGCQPAGPGSQAGDDGLVVTVSILPQKYFVERVGGEHVSVNVMVLPGANPATYEPKPEQLTALGDSRAYFRIGVPFEHVWLDRIVAANESMMMVDSAAGIERMPVVAHFHEDADDVVDGEENLDPHIWVSPALVKIQAQNIYQALVRLDPEHQQVFETNLDSFLSDIDSLDGEIRASLQSVASRKFLVFHPSWGYLARDYGLEMIPVEVGGQEPSAAELAELIHEARDEGIRVVFAQPEFNTQAANTIADEIEGDVLLISPLEEDWLANMRRVAQLLSQALER